MISVFSRPDECCGCTACRYVCPTEAISMRCDSEGFEYPFINQSKCIDCNKCIKACAFQNGYTTDQSAPLDIIAAKHKDEKIRAVSTSGGAFTALSEVIVGNRGLVYGACFDEDYNVIHSHTTSMQDLPKFRGSKYVQSSLNKTYSNIMHQLKEDKQILFTGTPCQAAGLKSYLEIMNIDQSGLYLCDMICHGVPSPIMWSEHVSRIELNKKSKLTSYSFRHKIKGWREHTEYMVFKNGEFDYRSPISQNHKKLFNTHNILRPACYNCKYANLRRPSDLTIADYWGIELLDSSFDDNKGVSLIMVNTEKGQSLFNKATKHLDYIPGNIQSCMQPQLKKPTDAPESRVVFWEEYRSFGYKYISKRYGSVNPTWVGKSILKSILSKLGILPLYYKLKWSSNK